MCFTLLCILCIVFYSFSFFFSSLMSSFTIITIIIIIIIIIMFLWTFAVWNKIRLIDWITDHVGSNRRQKPQLRGGVGEDWWSETVNYLRHSSVWRDLWVESFERVTATSRWDSVVIGFEELIAEKDCLLYCTLPLSVGLMYAYVRLSVMPVRALLSQLKHVSVVHTSHMWANVSLIYPSH